MATVLVTGGAGFIGSYVCKELLKNGHRPIVYDAFMHYMSPLKSPYQQYLQRRFDGIEDRVEILRGDTRNKDDVRRVVLKHRPSRIIHLAALPIADMSNTYSEEALSSILQGAVNVLEVVRDVGFVERFVYTSSSMVYGDFQYRPADEEHPKSPKDVYGGTKYAGEIVTESFGRRFGIKYTIIRPSAVYGPTDVNRRVSQIFMENAIKGKPLTLYGDGTEELDFSYVTDVARGFVLATFSDKAINQIFNITCGQGRSLKEYATILKGHFPELEIATKSINVFRPRRGSLSIQKAQELLGYKPQYPLERGVEECLHFLTGVRK